MNSTYPGAAAPPDGITANMDHPQDVVQTANYVIQGLTLFIVSIFVALKIYAKSTIFGGNFGWEDRKYVQGN